MRVQDFRLDAVFREHLQRRHADRRVIVVAVTGGVEHGLARLRRRGLVSRGRVRGGLRFERLPGVFRQFGVLVEAGDALLQPAQRTAAPVRPIHGAGQKRRPFANAVRVRKRAVDESDAVLLCLDRAIAQDQMREVDIEFMRRHIGALRHEAHVAKRAGVHDFFEIPARNSVEFAAFRFVDEIEEPREAVAEVEAAPAGVTNVEDAAHFGVELRLVIEIGVLPIQRMPDRRFETAFSHDGPAVPPPKSLRGA